MIYERHMGKVVAVRAGERRNPTLYVGRAIKVTPSTLRLKPYLAPHEVEKYFRSYEVVATFLSFLNPEAAKKHVATPREFAERTLKGRRKQINIPLDDIISVKRV